MLSSTECKVSLCDWFLDCCLQEAPKQVTSWDGAVTLATTLHGPQA